MVSVCDQLTANASAVLWGLWPTFIIEGNNELQLEVSENQDVVFLQPS